MTKVYRGEPDMSHRGNNKVFCVEDGRGSHLSPLASQRIINHSPDGFSWGYGGSGPAQLALAILLDMYGEKVAKTLYQDFKWDVVSKWPQDKSWTIQDWEIDEWVKGAKSPIVDPDAPPLLRDRKKLK